ncbi:heavy metal-associated isoprenylated plant protein 47-like [Dioscorea cayenensis subsp. rotundata]|uniref:Heavy metal-associated isoprenylated plant protein 47-like n=1 Tax=Dioscorea cayennensis subsp. rotundata TaxID=55577 RepID=A0AB40ARI4_DIOCR|nr:heavy metal-associated isoprenylated plant protein 47-like [Dioscorea cayenensis subsp. rotundata]
MKQKIVIKVQMNCEKCKIKAMKIVAATEGVESVSVEGKDNDQLVVIGDRVDSTTLTSKLRKKVGHAELVSVNEVKKPAEKPVEKAKPEKVEVVPEKKPKVDNSEKFYTGCPPAQVFVYERVHHCECESNADPCSIL